LEEQSVELNQSGVEIIFSEKSLIDRFDKDVEVLKLASQTLDKLNISNYQINIGSLMFFNTFIYYLEIPNRWKQRLLRHFFRRSYFENLLERINSGVGYDEQKRQVIMEEKFGSDNFEDKNLIEALQKKGSKNLGSRSAEEIAGRFSLKSENIVSQADGEIIVRVIRSFLELNGKLEEFPKILRKFVKDSKITFFNEAIQIMEEFVNAVSVKVNNSNIYFNNDFGHSIEFYDGMMFEIFDQSGKYKLISGGRYDQLLKSLGLKKDLSAIGFATNNNEIDKVI
jgi:ATP phosphoribosyltransferase regulatory subunit